LTNHWVWNKISTTGATTGAGTAYPYDVPKFSPAFSGIRVALSLFVLFSLGQCNICPLDRHLEIDNRIRLKTNFYDKRDDFTFPIVNFPFIIINIPAAPSY
jgi:hypothetical protein